MDSLEFAPGSGFGRTFLCNVSGAFRCAFGRAAGCTLGRLTLQPKVAVGWTTENAKFSIKECGISRVGLKSPATILKSPLEAD